MRQVTSAAQSRYCKGARTQCRTWQQQPAASGQSSDCCQRQSVRGPETAFWSLPATHSSCSLFAGSRRGEAADRDTAAGCASTSLFWAHLLPFPCMHRSGTQANSTRLAGRAHATAQRSTLNTPTTCFPHCRSPSPSPCRCPLEYYAPLRQFCRFSPNIHYKRPNLITAARPGNPAVAQQHACRPAAPAAFLGRAVAVAAATVPSWPITAACSTVSNGTSPKLRSSVKYVHDCMLAALLSPPGCCSAERLSTSPRHAADLCPAGSARPP